MRFGHRCAKIRLKLALFLQYDLFLQFPHLSLEQLAFVPLLCSGQLGLADLATSVVEDLGLERWLQGVRVCQSLLQHLLLSDFVELLLLFGFIESDAVVL